MDDLVVETKGGILHVILHRPEKLNAIDLALHERLFQIFKAAATDDSISVIALSGAGRSFCAGDDQSTARSNLPGRLASREVDLDIGPGPILLHQSSTMLRALPKPTVALLHGHALGSGYDYALSCDFRVATADARIGDPRVHRALWAAEGWSYKLTRLIGAGQAARIALLGEPLSGADAYELGLVCRLLPAGDNPRTAAADFIEQLAAIDTAAFAATKGRILEHRDISYMAACSTMGWERIPGSFGW